MNFLNLNLPINILYMVLYPYLYAIFIHTVRPNVCGHLFHKQLPQSWKVAAKVGLKALKRTPMEHLRDESE